MTLETCKKKMEGTSLQKMEEQVCRKWKEHGRNKFAKIGRNKFAENRRNKPMNYNESNVFFFYFGIIYIGGILIFFDFVDHKFLSSKIHRFVYRL